MRIVNPNVVIIIIVIVLVGIAGFIFVNERNSGSGMSSLNNNQTDNISISNSQDSSSSAMRSEVFNDSTISATPIPSIAPISSYIYPEAKITKQGSSRLEMESGDDPAKITNWYKELVKTMEFSAKSFTQTSTNGVIFNKLSAAKPGEKMEITIKKDQTVSTTLITVDRL